MKRHARQVLKKLGSVKAEILGWRDMWAMVTKKGDSLCGESFSKSANFNSWGSVVLLKVEVPLVSIEGNVQIVTSMVSFGCGVGIDRLLLLLLLFQKNKSINILSTCKKKLAIFKNEFHFFFFFSYSFRFSVLCLAIVDKVFLCKNKFSQFRYIPIGTVKFFL